MEGLILMLLATTGVGIVAMLVRLSDVTRRLGLLEQQLQIAQRTLGQLIRGAGTSAPTGGSPAAEVPQPVAPFTATPVPPAPAWTPPPAQPQRPLPPPLVARKPSRTKQEWEALVGEKLLNRVGAVALVIGIGFFLKYAFDENWISPPIRVALGLILGANLVVAASMRRTKYPNFTQGILGAGLGIMYLSAYAAFGFYDLVPRAVALVGMGLVTIVALERAVKFDSLTVAVLAWLGGFLTPILLRGEAGAGTALFVYVSFLTLALLLMVAIKPRFWVVSALTVVSSYATYFAWAGPNLGTTTFGSAMTFLVVIWAMFFALGIRGITNPPEGQASVAADVVAAMNGTLFYASMYHVLGVGAPDVRWIATLALSAAYIAPVIAFRRSLPRYALKSILLLVLATGLALDGFLLVAAWSIEALLVLLAGMQWPARHARLAALGLFGVAFVALLGTDGSLSSFGTGGSAAIDLLPRFNAFLNPRSLTFLVLAITAGAGAFAYEQFMPGAPERKHAEPPLHILWCLTGFLLLSVETRDALIDGAGGFTTDTVNFKVAIALSAVWAAYAVALTWFGHRERLNAVRYFGQGTLALAAIASAVTCFSFRPLSEFTLLLNPRAASVIAVIACVVVEIWILRTAPTRDVPGPQQDPAIVPLQLAAASLLFLLVSAETWFHFERLIATRDVTASARGLSDLKNLQQLMLSTVWLTYSAVAVIMGFLKNSRGVRVLGIGLLALTVLKVFLLDLSFLERLYRIISFIVLGLILIGASYLYGRYKDMIFKEAEPAS